MEPLRMGIQGLLPFVRKATHEADVKSLSGCTVAVDAYCWLHKGAFSCAEKLVKGEKTDAYVLYCLKYVNMLLGHNVKPVLVFDGLHLPAKEVTEKKRREARKENRRKARELLREDRVPEAREYFKRCVDVTPEMARQVIAACRKQNVDCIVAPYEADAQLAHLASKGIAQVVITEDSDLILFGCDRILFKLDLSGRGVLFEKTKLPLCLGMKAPNFTFEKFQAMCVLSGCDYLPSLPGIGLAKACKFFCLTSNPNFSQVLPKLPFYLNMNSLTVTEEYCEKFVRALNTFKHQLVFDPLTRKLVPLTPYEEEVDCSSMAYAGPELDEEIALDLALGNIDLDSMQKVDNYDPRKAKLDRRFLGSAALHKSIWAQDYAIVRKDLARSVQPTILSTLGKVVTVKTPAKLVSTKSSPSLSDTKADSQVMGMYGDSDEELDFDKIQEDENVMEQTQLQTSFSKSQSPLKENQVNQLLDSAQSPTFTRNPFCKQVSLAPGSAKHDSSDSSNRQALQNRDIGRSSAESSPPTPTTSGDFMFTPKPVVAWERFSCKKTNSISVSSQQKTRIRAGLSKSSSCSKARQVKLVDTFSFHSSSQPERPKKLPRFESDGALTNKKQQNVSIKDYLQKFKFTRMLSSNEFEEFTSLTGPSEEEEAVDDPGCGPDVVVASG
ncbi:unnamed protein product [Darwinula stevensoni]|uniref:Exonuclease 1 n=1 Tax=Darwinula stevensoni TaxID=69355 RepID=A0A7R9ADJ2_9CRUS|nr:unnamed protein product [Darwinula stevensoni]CAG0901379.1 unnamed protein product [Darwinula stevensoni]